MASVLAPGVTVRPTSRTHADVLFLQAREACVTQPFRGNPQAGKKVLLLFSQSFSFVDAGSQRGTHERVEIQGTPSKALEDVEDYSTCGGQTGIGLAP